MSLLKGPFEAGSGVEGRFRRFFFVLFLIFLEVAAPPWLWGLYSYRDIPTHSKIINSHKRAPNSFLCFPSPSPEPPAALLCPPIRASKGLILMTSLKNRNIFRNKKNVKCVGKPGQELDPFELSELSLPARSGGGGEGFLGFF